MSLKVGCIGVGVVALSSYAYFNKCEAKAMISESVLKAFNTLSNLNSNNLKFIAVATLFLACSSYGAYSILTIKNPSTDTHYNGDRVGPPSADVYEWNPGSASAPDDNINRSPDELVRDVGLAIAFGTPVSDRKLTLCKTYTNPSPIAITA